MKGLLVAALLGLLIASPVYGAQQLLEDGATMGEQRTKINANDTELYAAIFTNTDETDQVFSAWDMDYGDLINSTAHIPTVATLGVDDLVTLSGVASGAVNLGTFTGTTITDSSTNKVALQELETAVESAGGGGSALEVEDEGVSLDTAVTKLNFLGTGVTAVEATDHEINITVAGGGAPVDSVNGETGTVVLGAADIDIADSGSIITGTEVEAALQENRTAINLNTAKVSVPAGTDGQMIQYSGTDATAVDSISSIAFNMGGTRANLLYNTGVPLTIGDSVALGTAEIASGACATNVSDTATGVATTDVVNWGFNSDPTGDTGYLPAGMLTIVAYPGTNTVNFRVCNQTAAAITPAAQTLNWRVIK